MNDESNTPLEALLERAWATRRRALDADEAECATLLASAREDLVTAVDASRDPGQEPLQVEALHRLANVERDLGEHASAELLWLESIAMCRTLDRPLMLAHKIRHLADLWQELDRLEVAQAGYEEAMAIYRAPGNASTLDHANAAIAFAQLREAQREASLAIALWREARGLYELVALADGVALCDRRIAELETD